MLGRVNITLPETNISPEKSIFEDDFPFPKVGYVSFLEGIEHESLIGGLGWCFGFLESPYVKRLLHRGSPQNPKPPTTQTTQPHPLVDNMVRGLWWIQCLGWPLKNQPSQGRDGFGGGHHEAGPFSSRGKPADRIMRGIFRGKCC